jgi:predicted aspartyl protease
MLWPICGQRILQEQMFRLTIILFTLLYIKHVYSQNAIESVPIDLVDNLIFVDVFINEHNEPLHFLFDTGAGITVIDSNISVKIKLNISDTISIGTAGKTIKSELSELNRVRLGKMLILDNVSIAVLDLSHLSKYLKTNVDGVIGNELLQNLVTETNIDAMKMCFYNFENYKYKGNGTPYELIGLESGHLGIPFEIIVRKESSPIKMTFKIDTGADNYLTFHNETVMTYNLLDKSRRLKPKQGFGAEPTVSKNLSGKISKAEFCGKTFKNVPVVFEVDPLNSISKRLANGLVGQSVLIKFNITYNLNGGLAYFDGRE